MLRAELVAGLDNVIKALKASGLPGGIERLLDELPGRNRGERDKNPVARLLPSMTSYLLLTTKFSPNEQKIAELLHLSALADPEWWAELFSASSDDDLPRLHGYLTEAWGAIKSSVEIAPRILNLLTRDSDPPGSGSVKNNETDLSGRLSLALPEREGTHSSALRVVQAINAITEMYEGVAALLERSSLILLLCLATQEATKCSTSLALRTL
jgi:hypothetical protein